MKHDQKKLIDIIVETGLLWSLPEYTKEISVAKQYAEHMVQQKRERIKNIGGIHLNNKDVGNIINPINQDHD